MPILAAAALLALTSAPAPAGTEAWVVLGGVEGNLRSIDTASIKDEAGLRVVVTRLDAKNGTMYFEQLIDCAAKASKLRRAFMRAPDGKEALSIGYDMKKTPFEPLTGTDTAKLLELACPAPAAPQ